MTEKNISKNDYLLFAIFSSIWVFLGWIAYLAALGGFFYFWIFLGFFILMLGVFLRQAILKKISLKISSEFAIVSSAVLLFVAVSSFFVTPTVFSGRDQGAISEAAIRLSQNHKLEFSTPASSQFFKIYGPGKALNFPGFYYNNSGKLITQFPLAYISWIAVFYSFFGLIGFATANAVLLFIFLLSFYLLARLIIKARYAVILLVLTATSFPMFWFFKFTLSENMALTLLWLSILWAFIFIKEQKIFYYFSFLIPAGLLVFTRIEGISFLIFALLAIFFLSRKNAVWKKDKKIILFYPAIFLSIILVLNFTKDIYFYKELAKAVFHTGGSGSATELQRLFSPIFLEMKVFFLYGILSFLLLGIFAIIYFWFKKKRDLLIPLFITLPSFIYLANPWISTDHPWMLRRFVFSIMPALILYSVLFLADWTKEKKFPHRKFISYLVLASILLMNLSLLIRYFPFSENKGLLEETKNISENFSDKDLTLVDRSASGDPWAMISGPMSFLYNKNAVYFFNPQDIKKIDRAKFSKIYLITPNQNISAYANAIGKENMLYVRDYSMETKKLSNLNDEQDPFLPEKEDYKAGGKIFEIK
jgi:hypothetical protein